MADAEIEDMRKRMTHAAQMDAINRREGRPAMHKLKMLPEVVSLLSRNQYVNSLVDPEINLLEAVKFFLEPLDDGSLPAYNIQRDLMTALGKLPINKEALIASGIGKVIVFYTKIKRAEPGIKRMAERLLAEWTRPILQRTDDYSKRVYEEVEYDPRYVALSNPQNPGLTRTEKCLHVSHRSKQLPPKYEPESFSLLDWPTELAPRRSTRAIPWCRGPWSWRRANTLDPWEPVERTDSVGCGHDRLQRRREVGSRVDTGLSYHSIQFPTNMYVSLYYSWQRGMGRRIGEIRSVSWPSKRQAVMRCTRAKGKPAELSPQAFGTLSRSDQSETLAEISRCAIIAIGCWKSLVFSAECCTALIRLVYALTILPSGFERGVELFEVGAGTRPILKQD